MQARILVVGSLVMDLIVRSSRFVNAGETILGTDYHTASGGKGANQAVQAALLGADVTMVGKVGKDDFGRQMIAALKQAKVHTQHILVTEDVSSAIGNVQIEQNEHGTQNRIVVIPGANMRITPEDVAFLKEEIGRYDMVMLQLEIPMQINELVAGYASRGNVPVMLNSAPSAPLSPELLRRLTYISPNEHEAADLVGFPVVTEEDAIRAMGALQAKGVRRVLITRGGEGAVYKDENGVILSPSVKCEHVVDPTAAGDSFVGAFCTAICEGYSPKDALAFANHAASITVSRMGAQPSLPNRQMVMDLMRAQGNGTLPL